MKISIEKETDRKLFLFTIDCQFLLFPENIRLQTNIKQFKQKVKYLKKQKTWETNFFVCSPGTCIIVNYLSYPLLIFICIALGTGFSDTITR